jgi:hypothetical protein
MNWKLVASSGAPSFALGGISGLDCVVLLRILILLVDVEEHGKSGLISCCEGQDESRNRWKSDQCTIEIPAGSRFAYSFNPADLAPEVPGKKLTSAYEGASSHHLVPSRVTYFLGQLRSCLLFLQARLFADILLNGLVFDHVLNACLILRRFFLLHTVRLDLIVFTCSVIELAFLCSSLGRWSLRRLRSLWRFGGLWRLWRSLRAVRSLVGLVAIAITAIFADNLPGLELESIRTNNGIDLTWTIDM